ncbi:MAG: transposase [Pyrinomonadaceae bacterium]
MGTRSQNISPSGKRARFSKAFKVEALRLLELGQKPATQLALELGIQRNQLYKWQTEVANKGEARAFRGPGAKPLEEQSKIERLKRELRLVTEERDILKKAAVSSTGQRNTICSN